MNSNSNATTSSLTDRPSPSEASLGASVKPVAALAPPGADGERVSPAVAREVGFRRLQRRDRELLALLGLCRYLTVRQVVALEARGRTEKAAAQRLRGLGGDARPRGFPFNPALLRALPYRSFTGEPLTLWGLTGAGYAVAAGELARVLKAPRAEVGAVFAEHFVFLTDLFVALAQPYLKAGVLPRALPFRWNVAEDVELPWRDRGEAGAARARVIRPDAVLEVPSTERRFFIECETGSHTLTPVGPEKPQATVRKLERYDAFISGLADVRGGVSHYRRKYPDGWPCEVLFLVPTDGRRVATQAALEAHLPQLAGTRLTARALTLADAAEHLAGALPTSPPHAVALAAPSCAVSAEPSFYGEPEHGAVKAYVLDMTEALATANVRLRLHGLEAVAGPTSKARMLDFLRKAQGEMQRRRTAQPRTPHA